MDISHPTPPKIKQLSKEELFSIMRQASIAAEDARGGNPEAITTLEGLLEFVIQRELSCRIAQRIVGRKSERKNAEKKGRSSPNGTAIILQALTLLLEEPEYGWGLDDVIEDLWFEVKADPDKYAVGDKRTMVKILNENRTQIEMIAAIVNEAET